MLSADVRLWDTPKSRRRMDHSGEPSPRVVQIAGFDPAMMAEAARRNVDAGAQIIDINMGCPAKKVCNRLAGSALLQDEALVARILHSVVRAVDVPVTLKTRTGWDRGPQERPAHRDDRGRMRHSSTCNSWTHARRHVSGQRRTRNDGGHQSGREDSRICKRRHRFSAACARNSCSKPNATASLIGRAAQGRPWIFDEVNFFLAQRRIARSASAGKCP